MAALADIDLDAERTAIAAPLVPERERAGLVVLHPDRPEVGLVPFEAWHFSARQMDRLVVRAAA